MIEIAPSPKNKMVYADALLYCQFLNYNGYNDWRMPTKEEYYYINSKSRGSMINIWYEGSINVRFVRIVTPIRTA
jgi:hypothetical protein